MVKLIIGAVIAVFLVIGGFLLLDPVINQGQTAETVEVVESHTYTIEGEVAKVGTYTLSDAVTMADLIEAAGGVSANADDRSYYESASLTAGQTYYIASKYDASDVCGNSQIEKVNINTDDATSMMSINGITSSIASSIVSYRSENGLFQTIEQLKEVYGIGDATYRRVRNYVILHEIE